MADVPVPVEDVHGDGRWMSMHCRFVSEAREREPDLVLIGDSLIFHLQHTATWHSRLAPLHALNFGIGGDQTQHVLWRVLNGEMDNFSPKVVVILAGTNNTTHTVDEVAAGIMAIVSAVRQRQPRCFIIVMGLLPRGERPNQLRDRNSAVNDALGRLISAHSRCQMVDDHAKLLLSADGRICHTDMSDYLHLTPLGYAKVFEPISDLITELINELDAEERSEHSIKTV